VESSPVIGRKIRDPKPSPATFTQLQCGWAHFSLVTVRFELVDDPFCKRNCFSSGERRILFFLLSLWRPKQAGDTEFTVEVMIRICVCAPVNFWTRFLVLSRSSLAQHAGCEQKCGSHKQSSLCGADVSRNVWDQRAAGVDIDVAETPPPPLRCIPWLLVF